jgi:DNA polymerase (family 10)
MFEQLADLLEIYADNPFRIRADRNAATVIRGHARSMAELVDSGAGLAALPGIDAGLAGKASTIVHTDKLPLLD